MYNLKRKQAAIDLLIFHPASPEGPKVHLPFTAEFNLWRSWVSPAWRLAPAQDRQVFSQAWGKQAKTSVEDECLSWTQLCAPQGTLKSPAQWSCVACAPFTLVRGSPKSCHPWSRVWHGLCIALSFCSVRAFPEGLHPDHIVYREKKNGNWIIKIT